MIKKLAIKGKTMVKKFNRKAKNKNVMVIIFVAVFAVLGFITLGLTSAAGKKGGGNTRASISFSPNPATAGSGYTISGTGFSANKWVTVGATFSDGWTYWVSGVTDDSGNIVLTQKAYAAGQVPHVAKEQRNNGSLVEKATATLTVN